MIEKDGEAVSVAVRELAEADLMPGEVTIRVEYSSINYKDGLAASAGGRVVRTYPMVPGIDIVGTVASSSDNRFSPGDGVVAIGYDIGVAHFGGFAEIARVPAEWVAPLPEGLSTREAAALGTAGFTAAQSVDALERFGLRTGNGPVLVTGATGGVGSTAVSMLAGLGHTVTGSTGKADEHDFLRSLGAAEVLDRAELSRESGRPLEPERWAGAVDPVGGSTTATVLAQMKRWSTVALSGLTGGAAVNTTVMPFILRGVNLVGIESVWLPMDERRRVWARCASDLKPRGLLDAIAFEVDLEGVPAVLGSILAGQVRGRALVRLS
jgi:putative YhdH/YhfP family quinone oxidoreductase